MDSELNILINSIKEKTGINIAVYSESMKYFASTSPDYEAAVPSDRDFEGVFADEKTGKTFFRMKYRNAKLVGQIDGAGRISKNYAYLILNLIENSPNRELQLSQSEYLKSILLGDCNRPQILKYMRKYGVPSIGCFVMVISSRENKIGDIINVLSNFSTNAADIAVAMEDGLAAYVKFMDETSVSEYQSAADYAGFLVQSIYEETGVNVQIAIGGNVDSLADANSSFQQAMTTLRMGYAMNSKGEVHTFKEFLLVKMLEDIPKFKLSEYLEILLDKDAKSIFSDDDMINTAEEFLENNLNVSETSRKLYLHRNTLMYRLDKIERATGLNIRKFSDAVTFRLITFLYKLIK